MFGLTVTFTACDVAEPGQSLGEIVNRYLTVIGSVVVLIRVSLTLALLPLPAPLLIPATTGRVQEKVVPLVMVVAV